MKLNKFKGRISANFQLGFAVGLGLFVGSILAVTCLSSACNYKFHPFYVHYTGSTITNGNGIGVGSRIEIWAKR